jgi:MFS family permease
VVATFAFGNLIYSALSLHLVSFLIEQGYSPIDAAFAISVQNFAAFCTKPIWGMATDRFDVRYCATAEFTLLALGSIGTGAVSSALWQVYVTQLILGMGVGGLLVVQETVWASFFGRLSLGAIRSMGLPFTVLSGASGPLLAGAIYDMTGSYRLAFMLFIITSIIGIAAILSAKMPKPPMEQAA